MSKNLLKIALAGSALFCVATLLFFNSPVDEFKEYRSSVRKCQIVDRGGKALNVTYENNWNLNETLPLYQIPEFMQLAFIYSEDRNFKQHGGIDWNARFAAIYQNIKAKRVVRGASTISEQVVRMLHMRDRNLWSRWIEGWEAAVLENNFSKADILEFYVNQIPYAAQRRGVGQAAKYYFNRDVSTLSKKEMLALAVLPRSPSRLDLYNNEKNIEPAIARLANDMAKAGVISEVEKADILSSSFELQKPQMPVEAAHFVSYVSRQGSFNPANNGKIQTTLDADIQQAVQEIIDQRLESLKNKKAGNAAVLVADNSTGEILAWVIGRVGDEKNQYRKIDSVTTPRQPGSSLKPFLYTSALDKGWNAATIIDDSPYSEAVGSGIHNFNNYSHSFYGKLTLREALGNSLNIPALHTIRFVGLDKYFNILKRLGFNSLDKEPEFYNEGLALGNGEVTLFELVQAYVTLANNGRFTALVPIRSNAPQKREQIFSPEAASLTANILSDPWARRLEFGQSSVLNLPVQTAVKTGTSTDYRDAWAVGFNSRYTVGIWIGNLDHTPMKTVTGSTGPSLALRSIFSVLNRNGETAPLYLSPKLALTDICVITDTSKNNDGSCIKRSEYMPLKVSIAKSVKQAEIIQIIRPSKNLHMALDPRVPAELQAFEFSVSGAGEGDKVIWVLNGNEIAQTNGNKYMWKLERGLHKLKANVIKNGATTETETVSFLVK